MAVSGLVIVLSDDESKCAEALRAIERHPRLDIGPLHDRRLAVVLETESGDEDRAVWEYLNSLPGVALVEVAFVGFDPSEPPPPERVASQRSGTDFARAHFGQRRHERQHGMSYTDEH